jgi:hypothetical protein
MDHFNSPRISGRMDVPDRVGIAEAPGRGPYVAVNCRSTGSGNIHTYELAKFLMRAGYEVRHI